MNKSLREITWSAGEVGEAMQVLCHDAGLLNADGASTWAAGELHGTSRANLPNAVEHVARVFGVEAEPMDAPYGQINRLVSGSAPALLRLEENGQCRLLALLEGGKSDLSVVAPDRNVVRCSAQAVQAALCRQAETQAEEFVDQVTSTTSISARRGPTVRASLLRDLLSQCRIEAGWMLRPQPAASLLSQSQEFNLPLLTVLLLGVQLAHTALWVISWWLLGSAVMAARLDIGWLTAWALILASLVPLQVLVTHTSGLLSVRGSALIKRRLLFGALQLPQDDVRRLGAGQLLGRVLESEVLDTMALTGGFLSLTGLVDLAAAFVVLALGPVALLQVSLLVGTSVIMVLLVRGQYHQRRAWTDLRRGMTDDLVERMEGHRTRLAQQPREKWNLEEDKVLESYLGLSVNLDRSVQALKVLVPRGWILVGVLGITPFFVFGEPTSSSVGIAIGGTLLAFAALGKLTEGLERLTMAAVAWERITMLWRPRDVNMPGIAIHSASVSGTSRPENNKTLVEARDIGFHYPGRTQAVLANVNLSIRAGQQILLQGPSGGGKSTLGGLLAGLRRPESGLLLCRGLDRQTMGDHHWRRRIALAPQFHENHVFMGSLAYNLLMGRRWPPRDNDFDDAEELCRQLGLGRLLDRMPGGLNQMVGDTGWQLSHGERSRCALARALLQGADLLILDESLAALDPETMQQTLACVLRNSPSLLLIAHP